MSWRNNLWKALNQNRSLWGTAAPAAGEQRSHPRSPDALLLQLFGRRDPDTGIEVNETTALQVSAVYACVRVLSETIAALPLSLMERKEGGIREVASDHPLNRLVHSMPNPEQTSLEWREQGMGHASLRGNFYSQIVRDNAMRPMALWPLDPDRIRVFRKDRALKYEFHRPDGGTRIFDAFEVLHIKGRSRDGIIGLSPLEEARGAVGSAIATLLYGNRVFKNDARVYGVLEHPGKLSDKAHTRLKDSWNDSHQGVENAGKLGILEEGMKFTAISIKPQDAQFLEKRKFDVQDIARIFRVPPHLIQDLERATFSNVEQQSIDFVVHTIVPWVKRWEQAMDAKLLTPEEQVRFFFRFKVEGLLRGDIKTRFDAYAIGRMWGWLSANDVRALEDQNPLPAKQGDIYLTPLNMIPAEKATQQDPGDQMRSLLKYAMIDSHRKNGVNNAQ